MEVILKVTLVGGEVTLTTGNLAVFQIPGANTRAPPPSINFKIILSLGRAKWAANNPIQKKNWSLFYGQIIMGNPSWRKFPRDIEAGVASQ